MKRDTKLYLEDIIENIERIEKSIIKIDKSKFLKDEMLQDATIRRLEVIGEATKNIPETIRRKYSHIEWKKIAGIRDIIIHAYFQLDLDSIWEVITNKIADLKKHIKEVIDKEFGP